MPPTKKKVGVQPKIVTYWKKNDDFTLPHKKGTFPWKMGELINKIQLFWGLGTPGFSDRFRKWPSWWWAKKYHRWDTNMGQSSQIANHD